MAKRRVYKNSDDESTETIETNKYNNIDDYLVANSNKSRYSQSYYSVNTSNNLKLINKLDNNSYDSIHFSSSESDSSSESSSNDTSDSSSSLLIENNNGNIKKNQVSKIMYNINDISKKSNLNVNRHYNDDISIMSSESDDDKMDTKSHYDNMSALRSEMTQETFYQKDNIENISVMTPETRDQKSQNDNVSTMTTETCEKSISKINLHNKHYNNKHNNIKNMDDASKNVNNNIISGNVIPYFGKIVLSALPNKYSLGFGNTSDINDDEITWSSPRDGFISSLVVVIKGNGILTNQIICQIYINGNQVDDLKIIFNDGVLPMSQNILSLCKIKMMDSISLRISTLSQTTKLGASFAKQSVSISGGINII